MARKRRCKDKTSLNKTAEGVADAGQTSQTRPRNVVKEAVSRKRKAVSETPKRRKRSRRLKKVKSSSSVELVQVTPCCASATDRKKYAKLGLDSALFFSSSKPAKRKQSHISIITISSSDDEDLNNDETANWVSKIDAGTINISSNEEPFPSGDSDFSHNNCAIEEILDAEKFRPQRSSMQICSTPESTFQPLSASTPQDKLKIFQPLCTLSTSETDKENLKVYKGPSFLENPIKNFRQNLTGLHETENPSSISSTMQNQKDEDYKVKSIITPRSCSPNFYFGPSQNLRTLEQTYYNSEPTVPMWSDLNYFSTRQTLNANNNHLGNVHGRQETTASRYSLEQVPSTSHAPVRDPVLEVAPTKKKSKSRNNFPST